MPDEHRGRELPEHLVRAIRRLRREGMSMRRIALLAGVSLWAVQKYSRLPETLTRSTTHDGYEEQAEEQAAPYSRDA